MSVCVQRVRLGEETWEREREREGERESGRVYRKKGRGRRSYRWDLLAILRVLAVRVREREGTRETGREGEREVGRV